ncbi:MAG: response regulator transcription factor, partial [Acidobacteriota bacterium]
MTTKTSRRESLATESRTVRVLLVDRHERIRDALRDNLSQCGVKVVGVATDGFEAVERARTLAPDVVILDFHMPGYGALESAGAILAEMPLIRIIMLTMWDEEVYLRAATECGAVACFPKDVPT